MGKSIIVTAAIVAFLVLSIASCSPSPDTAFAKEGSEGIRIVTVEPGEGTAVAGKNIEKEEPLYDDPGAVVIPEHERITDVLDMGEAPNEPIVRDVLLVVIDPYVPVDLQEKYCDVQTGAPIRLTQCKGWNDVDALVQRYIGAIKGASSSPDGFYVEYRVGKKVVMDGFFPQGEDQKVYTIESYLRCLAEGGVLDADSIKCKDEKDGCIDRCDEDFPLFPDDIEECDDERADKEGYDACVAECEASCEMKPAATVCISDQFSYRKLVDDYGLCGETEMDEAWVFAPPWQQMEEYQAIGRFAKDIDKGGWDWNCQKTFYVMGFNYEREVSEMLESYGHRIEDVFGGVLTGWARPIDKIPNEYDSYFDGHNHRYVQSCIENARDEQERTHCGNIHFPPNSQVIDYIWEDSASTKESDCDYFYENYPDIDEDEAVYERMSCTEWGCTGEGFKVWWLSHIPKRPGAHHNSFLIGETVILNNWWKYIADYESALLEKADYVDGTEMRG